MSQDLAERIAAGAAQAGTQLTAGQCGKLARLLTLLGKWSKTYNLTAVRDTADMLGLHVMDSLSALTMLQGETVIDVGTGAGFPGLPLAIACPGREFTLLDSSRKKLRFVTHAAGELDLGNVSAVHSRVEDYAPDHGFDTVVCRAFASLETIAGVCSHLLRPGGQILAMKGRDPAGECAALTERWDVTINEVRVPWLDQQRHIVVLRQRGPTGRDNDDE